MRRLLLVLMLLVLPAFGQQEYVGRYSAFGGYSFLDSPKLKLFENGFDGSFGVNLKRWIAFGVDISVFTGSSSLVASDFNAATQQQLLPILAMLPPGTSISIPFDATTSTYAIGPQIDIRKLKKVTFLVRPALGALHESVTAKPTDPLTAAIVVGLVGPSRKASSTATFYGFGGGADLFPTKHVGVRVTADFVHFAIFQSFLNGGRNAVRFSIGPTFQFGKNVQ